MLQQMNRGRPGRGSSVTTPGRKVAPGLHGEERPKEGMIRGMAQDLGVKSADN